jgi:hypothetical protein
MNHSDIKDGMACVIVSLGALVVGVDAGKPDSILTLILATMIVCIGIRLWIVTGIERVAADDVYRSPWATFRAILADTREIMFFMAMAGLILFAGLALLTNPAVGSACVAATLLAMFFALTKKSGGQSFGSLVERSKTRVNS